MANTSDFAVEKPTVGGYRNTWGGTVNTALDKLTELLALALPVGTIQMYPKATAPAVTGSGGTWLICDGSAISRTTYSVLFGIIVETYGNGDGSNTFNIPDLRARVPVGFNTSTIGSGVTVRSDRAIAATSGGTEGHIITEAQLAAHSHAIPATPHDHDIDPVTHTHVGVRTDEAAGTEDATLSISDPGHYHSVPTYTEWSSHATLYGIAFDNGPFHTNVSTDTKTTGISIADHKHTFTTDAVGHGITTTETEVIGITETAPDTGSDTSHNNMQPFVVVQYIILAKHPTFA